MEELVRQGGKIHSAGSLKEAVPVRDEIRRLQSVALAVGDDPMARQMDIEATAGSYAGERPFGRAANLPSTRPRKPTDADMGPHNWGGGEARPKSAGKMRGRRRGEGRSCSYARLIAKQIVLKWLQKRSDQTASGILVKGGFASFASLLGSPSVSRLQI